MAKVKIQSYNSSERERITEEFIELVVQQRNKGEMAEVLLGLMTPSEILMFARRIQIAKEILKGGTQDDIRRKLKVGFDTMRGVEKWLNTGSSQKDKRLAQQILALCSEEKRKKLAASKSGLDCYPEHRLMKSILQKIIA